MQINCNLCGEIKSKNTKSTGMIVDIIFLVVGLTILILGANWLVEGASSAAAKFGISAFTIGLTVVAFGTSMPEFVVNVLASYSGNSGLALGNILGSNIINIFLVVGVAAIIKPIRVQSSTVRVEIPFSLIAAIVILVLANDMLIFGTSANIVSRIDGLILIFMLTVFLYYTFFHAKSDTYAPITEVKNRSSSLSAIMIAGGVAGLYLGGKLIVDSATTIAASFGVSDSLIGLTVVAIGTSLPELVTSAVAAYKGNSDIAIGNVLGSNIFNIFMVLGLSSIISPIDVYSTANIDLLVVCFASIMLFAFALIGPGQKIDRKEGVLFLLIYFGYTAFLLLQA